MEDAVQSGDLNRVEDLIRKGEDVNPRLSVGTRIGSLLMIAISKSYKNIALALLAAGANVHAKDEKLRTALHLACDMQLEEVAQALIDRGSRVDEPDVFGTTPLEFASGKTAMCLLRAGASCEGLPPGQMVDLFHQACAVGDLTSFCSLLKSGCSVHTLSRVEQEELLHCASYEGDVFVAGTLLKSGCSVSSLSKKEQEELLRCSLNENEIFVAGTLLKSGCCRVSTLSSEEQEMLLHCACRDCDTYLASILLRSGCGVSILSREEQIILLHCALNKNNNMFVAQSLLRNGFTANKLSYEEACYLVHCSSRLMKEGFFHHACDIGEVTVVEALIDAGCSVNCRVYGEETPNDGDTPLMNAAQGGHEEVVRKLILAGANLAMQSDLGYTALHYAASHKHIQCGILLAEAGASLRVKNNFRETPLDIGGSDFKKAITQALSFTTRKTLCIIGNAEGGKSTLIASLQAERTGFLGRIINHLRRVDDCRKRTAGIETVPHCSQRYGEVLFFDFAGQIDYHGPHQMFLESLLGKPGVSMTLLLVIKMTEEEEAILHQLHRWLTPVALIANPASPPHVIVIGSFLDKVKSNEEARAKLYQCILACKKNLEELPLRFVGTCFLNCRQPQSEGIDQLCTFLQEIPIPEFSAIHTSYSLAWVLSQIRSSITAQAVQLQEFSAWVIGNEDNLPRNMPPPEEVCQDLSAAGHALYLPNKEDPPKSWLVLNLPSILHDVYGTLFSKSKEIVNEFGLLHRCHLDMLFLDLDLAMVQQLLISLEFCIPVDPSVLKVELSTLTQTDETSGWLFFPALILKNSCQLTSESLHEESAHCLQWQLKTSKKHSISARVLQTILLHLAAHCVVRQRDKDGVQQNCCSIWWNGIAWQSNVGVDVTVQIMKNRVIHVIATSMLPNELFQYLTEVVSDILSTVRQLSPKLEAAAYIVHPPKVAISPEDITAIPRNELFPVEGIQDSIEDGKEFTLSLKEGDKHSMRMTVTDLFEGCTPSLQDIERIVWAHLVANEPSGQLPTDPKQPEVHTEGNGSLTDFQSVPSGAQALLYISSTPDMRDMDELVVGDVAAHWQSVALRLGVKGSLSEIIQRNHPNDCEGACRDLFARWLRRDRHTGEEERTWSTLLTALGRAGFEGLERRLRREHMSEQ